MEIQGFTCTFGDAVGNSCKYPKPQMHGTQPADHRILVKGKDGQWVPMKNPSGSASWKRPKRCTESIISGIIKRPENKVKDLQKNTEQVKLNFHFIPEALKILRR